MLLHLMIIWNNSKCNNEFAHSKPQLNLFLNIFQLYQNVEQFLMKLYKKLLIFQHKSKLLIIRQNA